MKGLFRPLITSGPVQNQGPPYVGTRQGMSPNTASSAGEGGMEAQMRVYGTVGVLFAIVSRLSEAVASADWGLYRVGSDKNSKPNTTHLAARLWERPNPFMDQDTFIETQQQHFELAGEADWNVARSSEFDVGMPLELWPVRPDHLRPVPSKDNFLDGWVYRVPGGDPEPWRTDEVIQMKRPNPLNPYRGLAPVASAMTDVYGEKAAAEWNAMFFKNDATPGGIIEFPERMSDEAFEEFVSRWRMEHQGTANSHRVATIEGGKWVNVSYSMRDMQFEELRKLNREFIRQSYGYPKSMLGDTENVNKASAIAGEYVFVRWMIRPRLDRLQATLNTKLLPMFGEYGKGWEFRYTTPVPADKELEIRELDSQVARVETLVAAGFDPSEVLKLVGLPDMSFVGPEGAGGGLTLTPRPRPVSARSGWPSTDDDREAQFATALSEAMVSIAAPKVGRRPLVEDDAARATWEQGETLRSKNPRMTQAQISARIGISDRTYRRYQEAFGR